MFKDKDSTLYITIRFSWTAFLLALLLFPTLSSGQVDSVRNDSLAKYHYSQLRVWFRKDLDSAQHHATQALVHYQFLNDTLKSSICLNALTSIHYNQGRLINAIKTSRASFDLIQAYSKAKPRKLLTAANNVAVMLQESGNSPGAIQLLTETLNKLPKEDIPPKSMGVVHQNIGTNYSIIGDYNNAHIHLQKALDLVDSTFQATILLSVCTNAIRHQSFALAEAYYAKINPSLLNPFSKIIYKRLNGILKMEGEDYETALEVFSQLLSEIPQENTIAQVLTYIHKGEVHFRKKEYHLSLEAYKSADQVIKEKLPSEKVVYQIEVLRGIASNYAKLQKWSEAGLAWKQAFESNRVKFGDKEEVLRHDLQWELLFSKIKSYQGRLPFKEECEIFDETIDELLKSRSNLISYKSRLSNSSDATELFNMYVDLLVNQHQKTGDLFEKIQQVVLQAHQITVKENRNYIHLLSQEKNSKLKSEYIELSARIKNLQRQNPALTKLDANSEILPELRDSFIQLLAQRNELKQTYFKDVNITSPKAYLNNSIPNLLIFEGSNSYYLLHDYNKEEIQEISKFELEEVTGSLSALWNISMDNNEELSFLYQLSRLIFPNTEIFEVDRLAVLSDGVLNHWPLEILPKKDPNTSGIRNLQFFGENTIVTYINDLSPAPDLEETSKKLLSIAPKYNDDNTMTCGGDILRPLICNELEAKYALQNFEGKVCSESEFDFQLLTQDFTDHDIIHFATHVCIDTTSLYNHRIILGPQSLYSSDLFNVNWEGKSVILSACASGQGALAEGEGLLSFTRWLMELGVKEVLVTYWPIDDCRTAEFMKYVFQFWSEDDDLPLAVFNARKSYFRNAKDHALSPKDWGAFVVIQNSPPAPSFNFQYRYLWLGLAAFIIVVMIRLRKD